MMVERSPLRGGPVAEDVDMSSTSFPIDLSTLEPLKLDPNVSSLTDEQRATLRHNIQVCRDTIVFFTALAGAKGLSGHTGGAYDTVPELTIIRAFISNGVPIVPVFYDEAGHRVAIALRSGIVTPFIHAEELVAPTPALPTRGAVRPATPV